MKADRTRTGIIFNIQKYSVNDGPGIRTVVFFKGCPLRCRWCSNPESQSFRIQILWDERKCLHCLHCIRICPGQAISLTDGKIHIDHSKCDGCKKCVKECPGYALSCEGELKSVEEIMKVVMQDLPFYEESNGGITLSGGEVMAQPDFAVELLKAAKEEGLHTCIETTGFTSSEVFRRVIENVDYILMDLKHANMGKHLKGTGVGNEQIVENMHNAVLAGKTVLPRIPVIPDFNDSMQDAKEIADMILKIGATSCQLLPFHQFGENKYALLGMEYEMKDKNAYHREDLTDYLKVFTDNGINAFM
ncbi:MAG: glycyl-radical enzyme activating protein [Erysipelotrichaceae bacterium]|nr:glycyl-radical enzyme activating protein [Erysipelotrichaceae bacterium]